MAHGGSLRQLSGDPELASHLMHDYREADLDAQTSGMLDFASKLTVDPGSMERDDVEELRRVGLSDQQILSVALITCLYNFMTRLADRLGVEAPPARQEAIAAWLTGPAREQAWLMQGKE